VVNPVHAQQLLKGEAKENERQHQAAVMVLFKWESCRWVPNHRHRQMHLRKHRLIAIQDAMQVSASHDCLQKRMSPTMTTGPCHPPTRQSTAPPPQSARSVASVGLLASVGGLHTGRHSDSLRLPQTKRVYSGSCSPPLFFCCGGKWAEFWLGPSDIDGRGVSLIIRSQA